MKNSCVNCKTTQSNWFLAVCGVNHKTGTIDERAPLALGHDDIPEAHVHFANFENVYESVAISTCNRIEFYLVLEKGVDPFNVVKHFYINYRRLDIEHLRNKFYTRKGLLAVEHLFNVAGGLDSMVLGESQIFGQIKESYSSACMLKTAGKIIHRLFHQAFRTGKIVRTETNLTGGANSVSGAAVSLLKSHLNGRKDVPLLFIGANEMIKIAAGTLQKSGYNNFSFANRTESRAQEYSGKYGGQAHALSNLKNLLPEMEVVVSCTGATEPIITRSTLAETTSKLNGRSLLIMDMAIPPDVEKPENKPDNLELFDLEDIDVYLKQNQKDRQDAVPQAQKIINRKLSEFGYWYEHAKHEPLTERIEHTLERIRLEEIATISNDLDNETAEKIDQFSRRLIERLLTTNRRCQKGH